MKKHSILFTILVLLYLNNLHAQGHDLSNYSNCKLHKEGYFFNSEKYPCPACEKKEKQEKEAKAAEVKRRDDAIAAKAKAEKAERERLAALKRAEDAKNAHSGELTIEMPKSSSGTSSQEEYKYSVRFGESNVDDGVNDIYYHTNVHPWKILYDNKVVFETSIYSSVSKVSNTTYFAAKFPSSNRSCSGKESNNAILINAKGERVTLPGIDKFGHAFYNRENGDYFDIAVFTGDCTPVYDDRYAQGDWHTIIYTFSYSTLTLVSSKPSWQHSKCACE